MDGSRRNESEISNVHKQKAQKKGSKEIFFCNSDDDDEGDSLTGLRFL